MKTNCRYCGSIIDTSDEKCAACGAVNQDFVKTAIGQPTTIGELQQWYTEHHLPPYEVTRFFIGENRHESRCFGIYKDETGNFVVYKNKDTGERAVRYSGPDEQFAVNEIYQKLKQEIDLRKAKKAGTSVTGSSRKRKLDGTGAAIIFMMILAIIGFVSRISSCARNADNGYYQYKNDYYYRSGDTWYQYDEDYDDWNRVYDDDLSDRFLNNYKDYGTDLSDFDDDYDDARDYDDWYRDEHPYSNNNSNDSYDNDDWDNDYDWDSGDSWDAGDSDWGSDW